MAETSNIEDRIVTDTIRVNLRNMLKSFDNYIKEARNYEQLEENLKHMEETDENFHKYDLVDNIRDGIENLLGDIVDKYVNDAFSNIKFDGDIDNQNKVAQTICSDILKTKDFIEFNFSLRNNINRANEYLMKNFHSLFNESVSDVTVQENESKSITFTNDFEYLSPDNSLNQNSFVFFNSEQFPNIAENLDPRKPDHVRLRAVQQLLNIPANDPPAAEFWNKIKKHLINGLRDADEKIADLCLKLHSRTLASSHPAVSKEIYSCLTENLKEYFRERELEKRALKANIDLTSIDNVLLLRHFRVLNDYAKEVTKYWTRYSETFVKSIIDETLQLFSDGSQKPGSYMTPVHYFSLLDCEAIWFTKWMHGHDSRKCVIDSIKTNESFLQNCIFSILTYASAKRIDSLNPNRKKSNNATNVTTMKRTMFRKSEIEFCHFIHSLKITTMLLCFRNGRRLFPVKIQSREVTVKDLIKCMIQIMYDSSIPKNNQYSPPKYTCNLLLDLCSSEETCAACFCYDDVIDLLLKPLKTILQLKKNSVTPFDENCILYMCNVLSKIASTENGYRQLLFGDLNTNILNNKFSPTSFTIMTFVRKALNNQLLCSLSNAEISECLYLARLLYSQCQGAYLIKEFDLCKLISESWKTSEKDKVIQPNTPRQHDSKNSILSWSDSLLDNMLCLASTPKGVTYLNETGLMKQIMNYMFQRYKLKSQVGKYEKFGYGYIVSQIANTSSGCFYLNESSLIQHLIDEIWTELEFGSEDFMTAFPRSYSCEAIDRYVYKPMLILMNILSSFPAVYEILADSVSTPRNKYSVREIPNGLINLMDRVIFINSDLKVQSLFNYEQSHTFGLRLLSYLQSDLDILLLLETQYGYNQMLLEAQKLNVGDIEIESSNPIIDILSIERNYVLVQSNLIGGPSEKVIPHRVIDNKSNLHKYPLFDKLPVPSVYHKYDRIKHSTDESLFDILKRTDVIDEKWLQKCRKLYSTALKKGSLSLDLIPEILSKAISLLPKIESNTLFASNDYAIEVSTITSITLTSLQILGIEKTIQYGVHINQLNKEEVYHTNNLTDLMKAIKLIFKQKKFPKSKLNYIQEYYPGYDWFVATVFLIFNGNLDSSWNFLTQFQKIYHSAFLWNARLYLHFDVLSANIANNGINITLGTICHYVEYIMKIELPLVFSAFRMSGFPPSQICSNWLKQCFWNYLDWANIVTYCSICILFGIDYQVYFCLSIVKSLSQSIIEHHNCKDLQIFLKESQIKNFKVENYFDYMVTLEQKYRQFIMADIKDFFNKAYTK